MAGQILHGAPPLFDLFERSMLEPIISPTGARRRMKKR
jgi:hypothetical protein